MPGSETTFKSDVNTTVTPAPPLEPPEPKSDKEPDVREAGPRNRGWVWVVTVLVLLIAGFIWYQHRAKAEAAAKAKSAQPPAVSVAVAAVQQRDIPYYITGLGSVLAFNTVTVKTRVDGQIMSVNFKEGQFVKQGDVLVEIDPRPFQVALEQAQGSLAKDLASQNDAKIDLNRYTQLWQQGVIARQQLDTQQATVGQFDGAIQADKAAIDTQKLQLTYAKVTAPISGRVGLRLVDPGNIVHAADANGMIVITQVQPITVVFTIPEDNLPEVVMQVKKSQLNVDAYSRDDKIKLATGKLLTIDNQIDQTTGTIKLKCVFDNKDMSLWPNQFVNIRLFLTTKKGADVVSSATLQRGTQGTFVYVVDANSQAQVRPVTVDFIEGNIAVIKEGLNPGEQVVVEGQDKLQTGAKVQVHPATTTQQLNPDNQPSSQQPAPKAASPANPNPAPAPPSIPSQQQQGQEQKPSKGKNK
jgi:membrane fusion protein, multidrug efflux system